MRLHIDGEGHGAVQYVQNMQNVHHVHRVINFLSKFVKVGSSGNNFNRIYMADRCFLGLPFLLYLLIMCEIGKTAILAEYCNT